LKTHRFHVEAESELLDQIAYYEAQQDGLGKRFLESVEAAMKVAELFPKGGSPYIHATRRIFPSKFPFSLVYVEASNELVVLAVAQQSRKPAYWKTRKREN
jgi:toxin ParE1/3/4